MFAVYFEHMNSRLGAEPLGLFGSLGLARIKADRFARKHAGADKIQLVWEEYVDDASNFTRAVSRALRTPGGGARRYHIYRVPPLTSEAETAEPASPEASGAGPAGTAPA